ncbi:487_t:CDS:2 [Dentiscutata heterogama]|uniref:487_t:CDS:1 n=1 Tax=Dentiscutata heterogama TaxID=1316150 RepID=A0ACA9M2D9_9GLOM|nr:487_t:CDS:2 [Dentiscutata heterogama]
MCSALIVAFSEYGLLGLLPQLGIKFLDKLEQNVDYQSTFRMLELIWTAVRVVLYIYAQENNISIEEISTKDNNLLKVWYNFYQLAGYLKLHKLGIRMANFDLQAASIEPTTSSRPSDSVFNKSNSGRK